MSVNVGEIERGEFTATSIPSDGFPRLMRSTGGKPCWPARLCRLPATPRAVSLTTTNGQRSGNTGRFIKKHLDAAAPSDDAL